ELAVPRPQHEVGGEPVGGGVPAAGLDDRPYGLSDFGRKHPPGVERYGHVAGGGVDADRDVAPDGDRPQRLLEPATYGVGGAGPCEGFVLDGSYLVSPWYGCKVCSPTRTPGSLPMNSAFDVVTRYGLDAVATADTVIVCAGHYERLNPPEAVLDALRVAHERG